MTGDGGGVLSPGARLAAEWHADGGVSIVGHDPGIADAAGPADPAGLSWEWRILPDAIAAAVAALGGRPADDALVLLRRWMRRNLADPGIHLRDSGVPVELRVSRR